MSRFVLDLSEQGLTEIDPAMFFERPFLVELDLSNNKLVHLPESISHCSLLRYVNISGNPMMRPPPVLFSIPGLRAHPENIVFGDGQTCSRALAQAILEDAEKLNQCVLEFIDLEGAKRRVSFTPGTSTREFFLLSHPSAPHLHEYVLLVRNCGGHVMRCALDDVPLSIYVVPDAVWSFELALLPPDMPASMRQALVAYVAAQAAVADKNDKKFWELEKLVQNHTASDMRALIRRLEDHLGMSSRQFVIDLVHCASKVPVRALVTKDSVALMATPGFYCAFGRQSLYFDYVENTCLLVCDGKALIISEECLERLLPLFALTLVEIDDAEEDYRVELFQDIARTSVARYEAVKDRRFVQHHCNIQAHDLDAALDKYRMGVMLFIRRDRRRSIKSSTPKRRLTT